MAKNEKLERALELLRNISLNAILIPDPDMGGSTDCYGVPLDDINAVREFLKPGPPKIEAYGVKGMASDPWRKVFKDADALNEWAEKNDAQVLGARNAECG